MDKKIILSLVIVALIGIVAATYQININDDDILNPFSSVDTEDSPITDTLATPAQAASQGANNQISDAQKQAQAQQAKDQAQAAQGQAQPTQGQDNSQNQQQQGSALITSENPVTVNEGQQSGDGKTSQQNNNPNGNPTSSDSNSGGNPTSSDSNSGGNPTSPDSNSGGNPTSPDSNHGGNPTDRGDNPSPNPNPQPTPDTDSDNNILTKAQAYAYIIKQDIGDLQIQQGSGYIDTGANNEKYIVFLAHNPKGPNPNEVFHVWIPQDKNSGFSWFIYEDGTGPKDVDPVNEGNNTQDNTNNTNNTN
ncbi:hypothetical protein [uncultured Methanosphaera sp.]|uniref:hypothetical protein n=1 Tax=uncultured Methanosphaera sp. TaxID=262501 RepID=UPI002804344F|nr:hypothetical protein [uncultured Methanosphaera sp.]